MTARRAFLSNFWAGTKGGLLTTKHIAKMGMARWLFDYLTLNQTSVDQHGVGVVNYGHPITLEQIASDMTEGEPMPRRTIERWLSILKREGYVSTEAHGSRGLTIWIMKAKDKTKKPRTLSGMSAQGAAKVTGKVTGNLPATYGVLSEKLPATNGVEFQNSPPHFVKESPQAIETPAVAAPIPKGFIPKSPSYYNKDAAAQTAAGVSSLLKEAGRELQPPRRMSQADLDARRRELLLQAERIKREHPAKSSPGKVVEMQPQEATA